MGRSLPCTLPDLLARNLYSPVTVAQREGEASRFRMPDDCHTSDNILLYILQSRLMTQCSFLEIGKALANLKQLRVEGQISSVDAVRASVLLLAILRFWELIARGRISPAEDERGSILLLRGCMKI